MIFPSSQTFLEEEEYLGKWLAKAITEMVPDLIWALDLFGPKKISYLRKDPIILAAGVILADFLGFQIFPKGLPFEIMNIKVV